MGMLNLTLGWLLISVGFATGLLLGLGFHKAGFLGGYDSLRRRMVRLGHIACVMLGVLNILYFLTGQHAELSDFERAGVTWTFVVGAVAMPLVCWLTAWRTPFRHLFFIPVASLLYAGITLTVGLVRACGSE